MLNDVENHCMSSFYDIFFLLSYFFSKASNFFIDTHPIAIDVGLKQEVFCLLFHFSLGHFHYVTDAFQIDFVVFIWYSFISANWCKKSIFYHLSNSWMKCIYHMCCLPSYYNVVILTFPESSTLQFIFIKCN